MIKNKRLRVQVIMFLIILGLTITNILDAYAIAHDFSHFRGIHLMLVLACGMLLGGIITRLRFLYFPEESSN